jgi:hypothetical protein
VLSGSLPVMNLAKYGKGSGLEAKDILLPLSSVEASVLVVDGDAGRGARARTSRVLWTSGLRAPSRDEPWSVASFWRGESKRLHLTPCLTQAAQGLSSSH